MVLCGWALAFKMFNGDKQEYDVVIRNSTIDYIRPVRSDARTRSMSEGPIVDKRNNNKSIRIKAELFDSDDILCASFDGEFIGIKKRHL
jgi:acyl-CoA thioesterase FadM